MSDPYRDREIERQRYNARAEQTLTAVAPTIDADGAEGVDLLLRQPYSVYEQHIRNCVTLGMEVLDLCCGDGRHSLTAARCGAVLTVSDIAASGLAVAAQRARRAGLVLKYVVADAESVPLPDSSFDIVTCAGSLSYLDHSKVFAEIHRVLKEEGVFICVDSLNHNPLYRFNRWIHYLLGDRTKSTLLRMPTMRVFDDFEREIGPVVCRSFHGIFSFLIPLLKPLLGESKTRRVLDYLDLSFPALRSQAFKFVAVVQKKSKTFSLKPL